MYNGANTKNYVQLYSSEHGKIQAYIRLEDFFA